MTNGFETAGLNFEQMMLVNQEVADKKKEKMFVVLLWLFFASLGAHRFYLGNTGYAICMILFGWATLFIWPLVDIIFALKEVERHNERVRQEAINRVRILDGGHRNIHVGPRDVVKETIDEG